MRKKNNKRVILWSFLFSIIPISKCFSSICIYAYLPFGVLAVNWSGQTLTTIGSPTSGNQSAGNGTSLNTPPNANPDPASFYDFNTAVGLTGGFASSCLDEQTQTVSASNNGTYFGMGFLWFVVSDQNGGVTFYAPMMIAAETFWSEAGGAGNSSQNHSSLSSPASLFAITSNAADSCSSTSGVLGATGECSAALKVLNSSYSSIFDSFFLDGSPSGSMLSSSPLLIPASNTAGAQMYLAPLSSASVLPQNFGIGNFYSLSQFYFRDNLSSGDISGVFAVTAVAAVCNNTSGVNNTCPWFGIMPTLATPSS